jgi:hypothetical protein
VPVINLFFLKILGGTFSFSFLQSEGEERPAGEMAEIPAPAALQIEAAGATGDPEPEGDQ